MLEVVIRHSHIVLDACCIINLAATDEFASILGAVPAQFVVASYVSKHEVLSYINVDGEEIPIGLGIVVQKGLILEADIDYSEEDEANFILAFEAENLDAGEAESAAIAINRNWAIATDDKRAINVIGRISPKTQILTTPELLKCWGDKLVVSDDRIKQAIRAIRKYTPPLGHPLANWWKSHS